MQNCTFISVMDCIVSIVTFTVCCGAWVPWTHGVVVHSTQVRHLTQIDLLTCSVCFVKHLMITTQTRHHAHLDLSTCRVCSVKNMMIIRQYIPQLWYDPYPLHARGLGLCFLFVRWSVICCQDGCFMVRERRIAHRVSQSQFWRALLGRTLGLFCAFPTLVGGHHWCLGATFLGS